MTLVTIESRAPRSVPVAGLGSTTEITLSFATFLAIRKILSSPSSRSGDDSREQAGCLGDNIGEFTAFERQEAGIGVLRASVETLARWASSQSI